MIYLRNPISKAVYGTFLGGVGLLALDSKPWIGLLFLGVSLWSSGTHRNSGGQQAAEIHKTTIRDDELTSAWLRLEIIYETSFTTALSEHDFDFAVVLSEKTFGRRDSLSGLPQPRPTSQWGGWTLDGCRYVYRLRHSRARLDSRPIPHTRRSGPCLRNFLREPIRRQSGFSPAR